MNYKIARTMLTLCVVYLVGFYILKFIFPNLLVQAITSPTVLKFGEFLNKWVGFSHIINILGTTITFYLFDCASCGRFKFHKVEFVIIGAAILINLVVYYLVPQFYTNASTALLLLMAWLCGGELRNTAISFAIHGCLSQLLLSIRGFETVITTVPNAKILCCLVLGTEMYVWLILLAIIFNIKEGVKNGSNLSAVPEQNG